MNTPLPIAELTPDAFEPSVLASQLPVLVAVCIAGHPTSQRLLTLLTAWIAEARNRVHVVWVDAAARPALVRQCGLPAAPGFALFHQGSVYYQFSGEVSRGELAEVLLQAGLLAQPVERPVRQGATRAQDGN